MCQRYSVHSPIWSRWFSLCKGNQGSGNWKVGGTGQALLIGIKWIRLLWPPNLIIRTFFGKTIFSSTINIFLLYSDFFWDFPGGPVFKNPPASAGDTSLIPGLEDPTHLWSTKCVHLKKPCAPQKPQASTQRSPYPCLQQWAKPGQSGEDPAQT